MTKLEFEVEGHGEVIRFEKSLSFTPMTPQAYVTCCITTGGVWAEDTFYPWCRVVSVRAVTFVEEAFKEGE